MDAWKRRNRSGWAAPKRRHQKTPPNDRNLGAERWREDERKVRGASKRRGKSSLPRHRTIDQRQEMTSTERNRGYQEQETRTEDSARPTTAGPRPQLEETLRNLFFSLSEHVGRGDSAREKHMQQTRTDIRKETRINTHDVLN